MDTVQIKTIARIYNNFNTKFAVPRQSGLVKDNLSQIVFEKEYRDDNALRGIEEFSHLWLIWHFSESAECKWSPTVRPPRLGGNKRMGVFATRSPYRPNPLGLSSVKLESVEKTGNNGTVLVVSGADLMNGTPIFDIKPYLSFTDCHADAKDGFAGEKSTYGLDVIIPDEISCQLSQSKAAVLKNMLSQDPRPSYIDDEHRIFGFKYGIYEIKFKVKEKTLTVISIESNS